MSLEGVSDLDDTKAKGGYKKTEREFENGIIDLMKAGYCVIGISHTDTKQLKDGVTGEKYDRIQPTLDKRGLKVASRAMDIIAFCMPEANEDGTVSTYMYQRGNKNLEAGSRYKYSSAKIKFTYDDLLADISQAIDKAEQEDGAMVVDKHKGSVHEDKSTLDYGTTMEKVNVLGGLFHSTNNLAYFNAIVEKHFGQGVKISQCKPNQIEAIAVVLAEIEDKAVELGLK